MIDAIAIILNWNELDYTRRCIYSLLNQNYIPLDILIIDNHSEIDPRETLEAEFNDIHVIRTTQNFGVAGGRNIGAAYAINHGYKYLLFLDNDIYADVNMLQNLLEAANKFPDTAIFGPKIYINTDNSEKNIIWRAGCTSWKWTYLHSGFSILNYFCQLCGKTLPELIDTGRGEGRLDVGQYDQILNIPFQIGAAQLVRASIFREIGFFDDEFIPYGSEDIDFSARVSKKGWKIKYIPSAVCWHRIGSSFRDDYFRSYFNSRNILLIARKHLSPLYFTFAFIPDFILLTIPLVIIKHLFKNQKNRLKGFLDAIAWNFRDACKRKILLR